MEPAMYGLVLANKKLDVTLCFFCRCATRICCADVLTTPTIAAIVPAGFISRSETVATPTPMSTTTMAWMTRRENFFPMKTSSKTHIVGICASLHTW